MFEYKMPNKDKLIISKNTLKCPHCGDEQTKEESFMISESDNQVCEICGGVFIFRKDLIYTSSMILTEEK